MDVKCPGTATLVGSGVGKIKPVALTPWVILCFFLSPGCYKITTVFSHAQTVVLCVGCSTVLCQPTGGKARLTEGQSHTLAFTVLGFKKGFFVSFGLITFRASLDGMWPVESYMHHKPLSIWLSYFNVCVALPSDWTASIVVFQSHSSARSTSVCRRVELDHWLPPFEGWEH